MTRRLIIVLLGFLAVLAVASPAQAATHPVTLGQGGPSPSTVTVKDGDTVVFSNTDGVSHVLKSTSKNWSLSSTVKAGAKTSVVFSKAGTFDYSDTYNNVLGLSTTSTGHVVVPAAPPSPSASATPKPSATSRPSASARPSSPASPVPSVSGSGVAVPPPITTGVVPTASPTESAAPQPQVAPTVAGTSTAVASAGPAGPAGYGDPSGLSQSSPRGFGLPTALAVVAVVGVATLLVRFLLATPEGQRSVR